MKLGRVLVNTALSLLAACGGDSKGPTGIAAGTGSGTVSFTYSGGAAGSYNATGAIASIANLTAVQTTTWAAGYKVSSTNSTNVVANMSRAGGIADLVVITMNRQTTGAGTIDTICRPTASATCNLLGFVIGASAGGSTFSFSCTLTSGTITVASISSSSAAGSFSGAGTCVNGTTFASSTFSVTNGSYNVPLVPNVPGVD